MACASEYGDTAVAGARIAGRPPSERPIALQSQGLESEPSTLPPPGNRLQESSVRDRWPRRSRYEGVGGGEAPWGLST